MGITTETGAEMVVEAADEFDLGQDALYERISRIRRAARAGGACP